MIAEEMGTKLRAAAASVLEMMFMAPVVADHEFPPSDVVAPILVGVDFAGQVQGSFALAVGASTAQLLALSFLGLTAGETLDRHSTIDVLGELANMLCGHLLGQLNYHDTFRLSSPVELHPLRVAPRGLTYQRTVHLSQGAVSMLVAIEPQTV